MLIATVRDAPEKRIDNLITWLDSAARRLEMTARVAESARRKWMFQRAKNLATQAVFLLGSQSLALLDHRKRLALQPLDQLSWVSRNVWFLGSPFAAAVTCAGLLLCRFAEWRAQAGLEDALKEARWEQEFREVCDGCSSPTSWKDLADQGVFQQVKPDLPGVLRRHLHGRWYGWAVPLIVQAELRDLTSIFGKVGHRQGVVPKTSEMRLTAFGHGREPPASPPNAAP